MIKITGKKPSEFSEATKTALKTVLGVTPIELTLAELQALQFADYPTNTEANDLAVGQQYYLTDKEWLLYVHTPTVLKPVKGSLHIFNGETLPDGIEPDVLLIDTGVVTEDISQDTGTTLPIILSIGYLPKQIFFETMDSDDGLELVNAFGQSVGGITIGNGISSVDFPIGDGQITGWNGQLDVNTIWINGVGIGDSKVRIIIEFHRSELSVPIPVPHIVSAETMNRYFILTYSNDVFDTSPYYSDFEVKVNGNVESASDTASLSANQTAISFDSYVFKYGDVITVSVASGNVKNTWGGLLAEVVDYPVVNNVLLTKPQFSGAEITDEGTFLYAYFDSPLKGNYDLASHVTVKVNGVEYGVVEAYVDGDGEQGIGVSLTGESFELAGNDVITVSIDGECVQGMNGAYLDELVNQAVTNGIYWKYAGQLTVGYSDFEGDDHYGWGNDGDVSIGSLTPTLSQIGALPLATRIVHSAGYLIVFRAFPVSGSANFISIDNGIPIALGSNGYSLTTVTNPFSIGQTYSIKLK